MKQNDFKKLVAEVQATVDNLTTRPGTFTAKGWVVNATLLQVALEIGETFEQRNIEEWVAMCKPVSLNWMFMVLSGYILDYAMKNKDHPLNTPKAQAWAKQCQVCPDDEYPYRLYMGDEDYNRLIKTVKEFPDGSYDIVPSVQRRKGRRFDGTWESCREFIAEQNPWPEKIAEISETSSEKQIILWIKNTIHSNKAEAKEVLFQITKEDFPESYIEVWKNGYHYFVYPPSLSIPVYMIYRVWNKFRD
jgi:hypothetical protein